MSSYKTYNCSNSMYGLLADMCNLFESVPTVPLKVFFSFTASTALSMKCPPINRRRTSLFEYACTIPNSYNVFFNMYTVPSS